MIDKEWYQAGWEKTIEKSRERDAASCLMFLFSVEVWYGFVILFKFSWMVYGKLLSGNLIKFYFRVIVFVIEDGSWFAVRSSWWSFEEDCFAV